MNNIILQVHRLSVKNKENDERDNRPYRLYDVSFNVSAKEIVLVVGGEAAGKTTLIDSINESNLSTFIPRFVFYKNGFNGKVATKTANLPQDLSSKIVILKDGFDTREEDHWKMLEAIKSQSATLVATAEIDKLKKWRPVFTRMMFLHKGQILADGNAHEVKRKVMQLLPIQGLRNEDKTILEDWTPFN